jgi:cysteinyl-tRNA synthetase
LNRKVLKNIPSPVEPSADGITGQAYFADILKRDQADAAFASAAREKEEKWGLYLTSLTKADQAIQIALKQLEGSTGKEDVTALVDGAADILGPYLGDTVSLTCFIAST